MSNYLVVWKRGIAVLSAGNVKVTPDPRIKLVEGYNLEIQDVQTQDAGDYVCQLGTLQPREITHTLEILGKDKDESSWEYVFGTKIKERKIWPPEKGISRVKI
ncbi:hypothetical protein RUM44_007388 [Polyplax serrata]|uniref:Ig-like domain-containing protein n=1 Tax=Polyplax serrata TaxID=468196 RepID=A0ABR1B0J4_POLSC